VILRPWVFHLGGLLLHSACVLLVFGLLRRLLDVAPQSWNAQGPPATAPQNPRQDSPLSQRDAVRGALPIRRCLAAGMGTLIFAIHPVQVESVAWISESRGLLCALFSLLALRSYVAFTMAGSGRQAVKHYLLGSLAMVLGLLSKPAAVAVPLLAAVLAIGWLRRPWRRVLGDLAPWLLMSLVWAVVTKWQQPGSPGFFVPPWWQRPLVAGDALTFYLGNLVFPFLLGPDYGRSPGWLLAQWWAWVVWVPAAGMIVALGLLRGRRIWLVGVGLWLGWLLPVLGFVPFDFQRISTVADRYMYLALLGPALVSAWGLEHVWRRQHVPLRRGVTTALVLWLALLGAKTVWQTGWWRDSHHFVELALKTNADSVVGWTHRGVLLSREGRIGEAIQSYLYALERHPNYAELHYNLGVCLAWLGNLDEAERQLREAGRLKPDWALVEHDLARVLVEQERLEEAEEHFRRTIDLAPRFVDAYTNLGALLERLGRPEEARQQYEAALRLQPDSPAAHYKLANLLAHHYDDLDGAVQHYRAALKRAAHYPPAHVNLGAVLLRQKQYDEALEHLRTAVLLSPRQARAWINHGSTWAMRCWPPGARPAHWRPIARRCAWCPKKARLQNCLHD